ncbi:MAG: DMT family protein, partial [Deltaproteobacteria bacterium]|nr:DMT family protein [Deltaproteobacteria bacterium]
MSAPLAQLKQGLAVGYGGRVFPILLLVVSNIFMTYAWYGHLKDFRSRPLL